MFTWKVCCRILSSFEEVLNNYPINSTNMDLENVLLVHSEYAASIQEFYQNDSEMVDRSFTINKISSNNSNITEMLIRFGDFLENTSTASIVLPPAILNDNGSNQTASSRIVYSVFDTEKLFFRNFETLPKREQYLVVGSTIVSASVYYDNEFNTSLTELEDPVIIILRKNEVGLNCHCCVLLCVDETACMSLVPSAICWYFLFQTLKENATNIQCSFWDPTADSQS